MNDFFAHRRNEAYLPIKSGISKSYAPESICISNLYGVVGICLPWVDKFNPKTAIRLAP